MKRRVADLILPVAILSSPLAAAIISIFGRPKVVLDSFYNRVWEDNSRSGLLAAITVLVLLAVVLLISSLRLKVEELRGKNILSSNYFIALLSVVLISVVSNFDSWGLFGIAKVVMFFWCTYVLLRSGLTSYSFRLTSVLVLLSYLAIALFPLVSSENSWKVCRDDKCTVAGSLLTSFFQSENALSLYLLSTVYFLKYLEKKWTKSLGFTLALALSFLTGSRLGVVVITVVILFLVSNRMRLLYSAPLVLSAISLGLFLFSTGSDLTGRGSIFSAVKDIWLASPIFGVGPNATQLAFERGLVIGFVPYNEQTEIAHLLAQYGIIATILFAGLMFTLVRMKAVVIQTDSYFERVAPFIVMSLAFATESSVSFSIDCPSFWVLSLVFAKSEKLDSDTNQDFELTSGQSANPYNRSPASPRPGTM